ncbi:MAG: 50S ribosomal protein L9 [Deltaproteobacteria bacterium]|nr:MAG: 50S ribosomal protein L9 [Deltaproteobacteria bacterium]
MEIILWQDVDGLGLEGDVVDVAKGYARNYLIPKGIGVEVSPRNMKILETQRKKIEVKRLKAREEAEKLREKIAATEISFSQKAGEEGKLYGSVTTMDIAASLEKEGIVIDRRKIVLEKPIKSLGTFDVPVRIYPGVTGTVSVSVNPEVESKPEE